jgi:hypothetical protein
LELKAGETRPFLRQGNTRLFGGTAKVFVERGKWRGEAQSEFEIGRVVRGEAMFSCDLCEVR